MPNPEVRSDQKVKETLEKINSDIVSQAKFTTSQDQNWESQSFHWRGGRRGGKYKMVTYVVPVENHTGSCSRLTTSWARNEMKFAYKLQHVETCYDMF